MKPSKPLRALYKRTVNELGDEAKDDVHLLYAKMNSDIRKYHVSHLLDLAFDMALGLDGIKSDNERIAILDFHVRYGNGEIKNDSDEKREAYMKDRVIVKGLEKYGLDASQFWYATLFMVDYIEGFDGARYYDSVFMEFRSLMDFLNSEEHEIRSIDFRRVKKSSGSAGNSKNKKLTIGSDTPVGRETIAHIGMALAEYYQRSYQQFCLPGKNEGDFFLRQYSSSIYHLTWTDRCVLFAIYMQNFLRCMSEDYGGRAPAGEWAFMSHLLAVLYPEQNENKELTAPGSDYLKGMANKDGKDSVRDISTKVENRHYPQDGLTSFSFHSPLYELLLANSR